MRAIYIVIKHEISTTLAKPSFWVMAFLFPALLLGLNLLSHLGGSQPSGSPSPVQQLTAPIGYIDQTGLIKAVPPSIPAGQLIRYADAGAADAALKRGEISQWVLIPAEYAETGQLTIIMHSFNPLGSTPEALFQYLLAYNLTGDEARASLLAHPSASLEARALKARAEVNPLAEFLPYTVLMIFFFFITFSSGLMLNSVAREKMNRTAEVLLLSLEPRELMLGKIVGLSVAALVQMLVWAGGAILLNRQTALLQLGGALQLPASLLLWAVVFFLLGYLMYAALMGAAGALAPTLRDAGQVTFFIILPLMIPMLLSATFADDPNGLLPVGLSLLPFTAPTAMLARLVLTSVPAWQIALSLGLLLVATGLTVQASARAFRADTLLSSAVLSPGRLITELRGR